MSQKETKRIGGFTIIELMLAMTIFSVVLVAAAAGLIQIGRMYYQTVIASRTQDTARAVSNEISTAIQFSGSTPVLGSDGDTRSICVGNTRYSYVLNEQLAVDAEHVLWRDEKEDNACTPADLASGGLSDGVELLGENMRLFKLDVAPFRSNDYRISLYVTYGDDDVLTGVDASGDYVAHDSSTAERLICNPDGLGTQFCAISELSTLVARRL